MSRLEAIQRAMVELVRAPDEDAASIDGRRAWLESNGIDARDRAPLESADASRLLVYRRLIRGTLEAAIKNELPKTAELLGARMHEDIARFLSEKLTASHHLLDLAFELVEWATPAWRADSSVPRHAVDLASFELTEFEVAASPDVEPAPSTSSLEADRPVVLSSSLRLRKYDYAVHDLADSPSVEAWPTWLVCYRDAENDIGWVELDAVSHRLLERLIGGEPLGAALHGAAADTGEPLDEALVARLSELLTDLAERGLLFGSATESGS